MMKTYNTILLFTVCFLVSLCAGILLWVQPINGDLTRIGAYPERWFGWNRPQQKIPDMNQTQRSPEKKHILVVGDSFSEAGRWQAGLSEHYSFDFIHAKDTNLRQLASVIARKKPDGVVIESVERFALAMFGPGSRFMGKTVDDCRLPPAANKAVTDEMTLTQAGNDPAFPFIDRKTLPGSGKDISQGFHYLKLWGDFARKPKKRKAKVLELSSDKLFSNQRSNQLLVIVDDLLLSPDVVAANLKTAQCSLQGIADMLQDSGVAFAILLIPDKTTAYQAYLTRDDIRTAVPAITQIAANKPPHTINMLPMIRQQIDSGERDFYLPNDTHWGYKGFLLASAMVDTELSAQWSSQPPAKAQPQ